MRNQILFFCRYLRHWRFSHICVCVLFGCVCVFWGIVFYFFSSNFCTRSVENREKQAKQWKPDEIQAFGAWLMYIFFNLLLACHAHPSALTPPFTQPEGKSIRCQLLCIRKQKRTHTSANWRKWERWKAATTCRWL